MSEVTTETAAEIPAPTQAEAPVLTPTPVQVAPTPKPKVAPQPEAEDKPKQRAEADRPDPIAVALKALQDDNANLAAELKAERAARTKAERERDARAQEHDTLSKRVAESAIVSRLRDMAPAGVPERDIRGALIGLAEEGKVDRYSADPDAAAKAAAEILKASNSTIFRASAPPGGPNGAPPQTPVRRHISAVG